MNQSRIASTESPSAQSHDPNMRRALVIYHEGSTTGVLEVAATDTIEKVKGNARSKAMDILEQSGMEKNSAMLPERRDIVLFNHNHAIAEFQDKQTVGTLCPDQGDHIIAVVPSIRSASSASPFDPLTSPVGDASISVKEIRSIIASLNEKLAKETAAREEETAALKEETAALKEETAALKEETAALKEGKATAEEKAMALEKRVISLEKTLDASKENAKQATSDRMKAKKDEQKKRRDLETLQGQKDDEISALKSRMRELESRNETLLSRKESEANAISVIAGTLCGFQTIPDNATKELDKIIRRTLHRQMHSILRPVELAQPRTGLAQPCPGLEMG
ncbi:hypothetical protein BOTBODRAFT_48391 [Botryobasidium botryosum FD-172 SS1]|uniref:Uncharacterized protein n=1 Tax=Botryobasidium botryosum (strain FD-172 SS1) TaxID=930990 RepID=A0A067M0A7_BOTB1|nr:hypothetical protein BOTBODRAFT_48391 [Botryobasidium botryosum FD-172 SS1]